MVLGPLGEGHLEVFEVQQVRPVSCCGSSQYSEDLEDLINL